MHVKFVSSIYPVKLFQTFLVLYDMSKPIYYILTYITYILFLEYADSICANATESREFFLDGEYIFSYICPLAILQA